MPDDYMLQTLLFTGKAHFEVPAIIYYTESSLFGLEKHVTVTVTVLMLLCRAGGEAQPQPAPPLGTHNDPRVPRACEPPGL